MAFRATWSSTMAITRSRPSSARSSRSANRIAKLGYRPPEPYCGAAVAALYIVERPFEPARLAIVPVEQCRQIGAFGANERIGADPDQAESRHAIGFNVEEMTRGAEEGIGELARVGEPARARADAEIAGLELQGHGAGGERRRLQTGRHLLAQRP